MKTRNNIYHNLEESPFITKFNNFRFSFSSKFYQNKFEENLVNYINEEGTKFRKKYQLNVNVEELLAFNLYRKIEKRGCFVKYINSVNTFVIKNKLNVLIQVKE